MTRIHEIANALARAVLGWRDLLWRNNVGRSVMPRGGRVVFGIGNPGGSDLVGVYRGRAVFIEIKTPTGRVSPDQLKFQRLVERHGGIYVVSIDQARWLNGLDACLWH